MQRHNYDQKILTLFDTVGSFFVDVFYNSLFIKAKSTFNEARAQSLTDAYKSNIIQYTQGINTYNKLYITVIKQLHGYYQQKTRHTSGILSEFMDTFLSKFIPKEYYRDFNEKDKDKTLREIIIKTVKQFGDELLRPTNMRKIIDDHRNPGNVTMLQDFIVNLFLIQREEYYTKFTKQILKESSKVSLDVFNTVKQALKDETQRRVAAEADRDKAVNIISGLVAKLNNVEAQLSALQSKEMNDSKYAQPPSILRGVAANHKPTNAPKPRPSHTQHKPEIIAPNEPTIEKTTSNTINYDMVIISDRVHTADKQTDNTSFDITEVDESSDDVVIDVEDDHAATGPDTLDLLQLTDNATEVVDAGWPSSNFDDPWD